ncbi:MAG: hypothetical protein QOF57_1538 [Frankiaceae bacterium]|nr:hypothetical protein [Frankiaceae bacterium]
MSVRRTAALGAVLAASLAACRSPSTVALVPPTPTGATATACAALVSGLAHDVAGRSRRSVSPSSPYVAAWGDPPILLRCGVPAHESTSADSEVDVGGITWRVRTIGDYVQWDSVNRATGVEVRVPLVDTSQEGAMSEISDAVRAAIPAGATPAASPS